MYSREMSKFSARMRRKLKVKNQPFPLTISKYHPPPPTITNVYIDVSRVGFFFKNKKQQINK